MTAYRVGVANVCDKSKATIGLWLLVLEHVLDGGRWTCISATVLAEAWQGQRDVPL